MVVEVPAGWVPAVSIVVPTYRRAQLLPRLFAALARQSLGTNNFELVVVDDASTDGTAAALSELAARAPFATTVLRAAVNAGPAAARNRGWRAARARVVALTDDDCTPTPGWLAAGLAALDDEHLQVVVGRTVPDPAQLDRLGAFSRTMHVEDASFMQTCNIFYRRADLDRVGGFDERLRTGEDIDLGLRVAAGACAEFAPDALVHHDVRASRWRSSLREAWSWVDLPLVVRKHPGVRRSHAYRRIFWKRSHPPTLLALVGLGGQLLIRRRSRGSRCLAGLALALPWLRLRLCTEPLAAGRLRRVMVLPGALAVDVVEVTAMMRGSVRHRTLYL